MALDVICSAQVPVKASLGSPCDLRISREVSVAPLNYHPRKPSRTPPRRASQRAGRSAPMTAQLFFLWSPGVATGLEMEAPARRVYYPGEWPPGIVEAPGQAWQVTRLDLWKELPRGVLATIFSGGSKNLESLNLGWCGCNPRGKCDGPGDWKVCGALGAPRPLCVKEVKFLATGDPFHNDEPEAVCAPRCTTCTHPSVHCLPCHRQRGLPQEL